MRGFFVGFFHIAAGAVVLVIAGLISGHFGIFFDTGGYVRQGEYMANRLFDVQRMGFYPMMSIIPGELNKDVRHLLSVIDARSPSYSLFLYLGSKAGGFAFVAWLQALAAVWLIGLTARLAWPERRWTAYWIVIVVLALGSSLPFFVDFAMPDVFGGIAILCIALLYAASEKLGWAEVFFVWLLMVASLSVHRSNMAVAAALVIVGFAGLLVKGWPRRSVVAGGAAVTAALALIVVGGGAYKSMLQRDMGIRSGSPTFLMARVLADGTGRDYLVKNCPGGVAPALCAFRKQALDDANVILWNLDPGVGVFNASPYDTRLELQDQEKPFVLAAILAEPLRFARSALHHFLKQITMFSVDEPLEEPGRYIAGKYPDLPTVNLLLPGIKACATFESCPQGPLGKRLAIWHGLVIGLSLLVIAGAAFASFRQLPLGANPDFAERVSIMRGVGTIILCGIIFNAAVCGILSDPVLRYQARLIWLLPMTAILCAVLLFGSRRATGARNAGAIGAVRPAPGAIDVTPEAVA